MIFRSLLRIRLRLKLALTACFAAALTLAMAPAQAEEPVLNLYSARHYATDEALYANFTQATGIRIHPVDADARGLVKLAYKASSVA